MVSFSIGSDSDAHRISLPRTPSCSCRQGQASGHSRFQTPEEFGVELAKYLAQVCDDGIAPRLKLDHPRQLAVMSSLVRFSHVAARDTFTTPELQAAAAEALGMPVEKFPLGRLSYELWKLRAKGLVEKLPHSRRYRLLPNGYRICLVLLKLFDKIYAPLTAGLLHPSPGDQTMTDDRLHHLDKLTNLSAPLWMN